MVKSLLYLLYRSLANTIPILVVIPFFPRFWYSGSEEYLLVEFMPHHLILSLMAGWTTRPSDAGSALHMSDITIQVFCKTF